MEQKKRSMQGQPTDDATLATIEALVDVELEKDCQQRPLLPLPIKAVADAVGGVGGDGVADKTADGEGSSTVEVEGPQEADQGAVVAVDLKFIFKLMKFISISIENVYL